MLISNPFAALRMAKSAVLSSAIRSAEKSLRNAEAARRTALEIDLEEAKKKNEELLQQMAEASANNTAMAQQMATPMPSPPSAQPQFGAMLQQQNQQASATNQPAKPIGPQSAGA